MHVHLPKPLHGWRELAGEVGIIVIGVLIALSAEQVVETIHWRHTMEAERKALDNDVADMWNAMSARTIVQHCIDDRLSELALVFARHQRGEPLGLIGPIGRPGVWTASTDALDIASADQSLSHMSFDEKHAYFDVHESYQTFAPSAQEERASWRELEALNAPETLDDTDWRELRKAYRDAIDTNRAMKSNLVFTTEGDWLTPFARFGRFPPNTAALDRPMVVELCRPAVKK